MVSTPDPSTQVDYLLTVGQVAPVGVQASEGGDAWPDGTYTMVGGAGLAVAGTAVLDGDTLTLDWPTNVHADVLSQPYEVRVDGVRFMNGQVQGAPGAASGTRTLDVTLNLGGPTIAATITVVSAGPVAADAVTTRAWTGRLEGLDPDVGAVLDMIDAGLDDHYVAMFVTGDDDYSGGTLTGITLYDTGATVSREYVVTAPVCVVDGPDMGLWTITASGPCTPGRSIDPGDIIRAFAQGFIAVAGSSDGETVSGINVAATYETVREIGELTETQQGQLTALAATVGTQGALLDAVDNRTTDLEKNASEAATGLALTAHANGMGTVWAWAECGLGDIGYEAPVRGYWSCPVILPTPTSSIFTRALVRSISGSRDPALYQEICSEPMDSFGVPGDGGAWDHDEFAILAQDGALSAFFEWTANGGTTEWHTDQDPVVDPPYGPGIPPGAWVELAVAAPDFSTGILYLLARTDHGNYVDPWDEDRWRILCTYDTGAPITFEDTTAVEMWIGRGGGRIDIARVRRWIDDVFRSDFNPFFGGNGATTIADQVLVDENDDPAIWTASDNAVNVNND